MGWACLFKQLSVTNDSQNVLNSSNIMINNDKHFRYHNWLFTRSNDSIYLDPVLDKLEESLVDEGRFLDSPELDAMLPTWAVIELCNIILKTKLKTLINNWSNWNCNFCKDWIVIELAKIDWLRFKNGMKYFSLIFDQYLFEFVRDWVCSISSAFLITIAASSFSFASFWSRAAVELKYKETIIHTFFNTVHYYNW